MKKYIKHISIASLAIIILLVACKKTEYSFGNIKTPSNLAINVTVVGTDASHPYGNGSGKINVSVSATNAITYKIYFGTANGDSAVIPTGVDSFAYTTLDTNMYTITVDAIGTGGATSTLSKQIKVLYTYQVPPYIIASLTNGSSRTWKIANDTTGHLGVGPANTFTPDYYKAQPNEKPDCAYGSVITFTQLGSNSTSMNDNNSGSTFVINDANSFYGVSGGDGCYPIATGGTKNLSFFGANTGSNSSNSTGVMIGVPGNGVMGFGLGSTTYEILSINTQVMVLRTICSGDGLAWYQILRATD